MFLSAVCLGWSFLGLPSGQGTTNQPVTLILPAAPVPKIVSALGKATGIPMAATARMSDDIVLLDVHARPLDEVMNRIAEVTDGVWKKDHGTYRLSRTTTAERGEFEREKQYRKSQILAEVNRSKEIRESTLSLEQAKKLAGDFEKQREKNPQYAFSPYAELSDKLNMTPVRRALLRCIAALDLNEISMFQPGDRIAFSNKPTRTQRPLNFSCDAILAKFTQEQNTWASAVSGRTEAAQNRFDGDPLDAKDTITQTPDRILLIAHRSNSSALAHFQIYILAGTSTLGSTSIWVGNDFTRNFSKSMMNPPAATGTKITLGSNSKLVLEATKGWMNPNQRALAGPPAAALDLLAHPDETDPLSLVPTDGFVSIAEVNHLNLIASLPDDLVGLNFFPSSSSLNLTSFAETAEGLGNLQMSEKDGWVVVKSRHEFTSKSLRLDRTVLGKYLRSIQDSGRASLDAEGEFALKAQPSDYDTFGVPFGMLFDPNSTQNVDQDWISLKLWGSLTAGQRRDLISGQKILFKDLTADQLGLVEREAYHRPFKHFSGPIDVPEGTDFRHLMEPTECIPGGLPADGELSLSRQNAPAILASSTAKNVRLQYVRIFDAQSLGNSLAYYESAPPDQNPMFDRFQEIQRANYALTYKYSTTVLDKTTLHDIVVPSDSKPAPFSSLPKDVQTRILSAKQQAKDNPTTGIEKRVPPPL